MQAIILAAGMGKRLKDLTKENTKCMIKVNGQTLIERMLRQLDNRELSLIIMVVGYKREKLKKYVNELDIRTEIVYIDNPVYDKTNNIYSLSLAKEYLQKEDTLLFESDIIFEDSVLDSIVNDERQTLALVDKYEPWMDGTCVRLDNNDRITDFISGRNFDFNNTVGCYKTVNIYKFSKHFSKTHYIPFLDAYQQALGQNEYYEQVLRVITMLDDAEIRGKRLEGQKWYEIDDTQDLDIAETIFSHDADKVLRMAERYGGYWRFPRLLDFCYLVNPYFPPQKMKDEIRASFDRLIIEYPSGMKVNSMLAAKNFGVRPENIVVGNGASELIKALMERIEGRIGIIRPTFEEYPNRYDRSRIIAFEAAEPTYLYNEDDVIGFFDDKGISLLILINPDNPSGNYIDKNGLHKIIDWSGEKGITLLIDESFADFAEEKNNTLISQKNLEYHPWLCVMKSISKSYGVPGLRLGVLVSGNIKIIDTLKRDISIWNINSFAEFYMQIMEKYKGDYEQGLEAFKKERMRFGKMLEGIDYIQLIPSQANYFCLKIIRYSANEITKYLLVNNNILVKDLSEKLNGRQYIRVAIRNEIDDGKLVEALKDFGKLNCNCEI